MKTREMKKTHTEIKLNEKAIEGKPCYSVDDGNGIFNIYNGREWAGYYKSIEGELVKFDQWGRLNSSGEFKAAFVNDCRLTNIEQSHMTDDELKLAAMHFAQKEGLDIDIEDIEVGLWLDA